MYFNNNNYYYRAFNSLNPRFCTPIYVSYTNRPFVTVSIYDNLKCYKKKYPTVEDDERTSEELQKNNNNDYHDSYSERYGFGFADNFKMNKNHKSERKKVKRNRCGDVLLCQFELDLGEFFRNIQCGGYGEKEIIFTGNDT